MIGSRITLAITALGIVVAATACSDQKAPRDETVAQIKADPRMAGADDRTVDCIADWYENHATDEQREALRDGGIKIDAAPAGSRAEAAMLDCIKLATESGDDQGRTSASAQPVPGGGAKK